MTYGRFAPRFRRTASYRCGQRIGPGPESCDCGLVLVVTDRGGLHCGSYSAPADETHTRSQTVARIADRTASQHFWGHVTSSVTWPFESPYAISISSGTGSLNSAVFEIFRSKHIEVTSIGVTTVQKVGVTNLRGPKGRSSKPEGLRGWERGWGSWGGGSQPPPHQLGVWGAL